MGKERRLQEGRLDTRIDVTEDARRSGGQQWGKRRRNQENIAKANDLEHQMIIAQEAV